MAFDQSPKEMSDQTQRKYKENGVCHRQGRSWHRSCLACLRTTVEVLQNGANLIYANLSLPSLDAFAIEFCLAYLHGKSNMLTKWKLWNLQLFFIP